jgi:hypothetical protein
MGLQYFGSLTDATFSVTAIEPLRCVQVESGPENNSLRTPYGDTLGDFCLPPYTSRYYFHIICVTVCN